jgi:ABC-2 type transport system ATP-binding protein
MSTADGSTTSPAIALSDAAFLHAPDTDGTRRGLHPTTISFMPGSWTALVGANGSGKTTLGALCYGTRTPTSGHAELLGEPTSRLSPRTRTRVAVAPQELSIDPVLTVRENLVLAARLRGQTRDEARTSAEHIERVVGLHERTASRVSKLSGGLQRRAHIARALVARADVVILDEPDAGMDQAGVDRLREHLRAVTTDGSCLITITHDASLARSADRAVALADGWVVADGSPGDLLAELGPVVARASRGAERVLGEDHEVRAHADDAGVLITGTNRSAVERAALRLSRAGFPTTIADPTLADVARAATPQRAPGMRGTA